MKIIAIIPARYASTRFPGKPLVAIGGKQMIQHVYERTSARIAECWVATDDERIKKAVEAFGGNVVMTSPDHRSGTDRCAEALEKIERSTERSFDVVVNVQGDEPFIAQEHLSAIVDLFDSPQTEIATLVKIFGEDEDIFNPNLPKVVVSAVGEALYFSRSPIPYLRGEEKERWQQQWPYYKHIGMYAYRGKVLRRLTALKPGALEQAESLEQLRWLENGYRIAVKEVETETVAVDTPDDLARIEQMLRNGLLSLI